MPSYETQKFIDALTIDPNKPLIISDADEVIFELFGHLFKYFDEYGFDFRGESLVGFEIMNHLYCHKSGETIKIDLFHKIMADFFEHHGATVPFVENAYKNLTYLSSYCQIIILTNAPHSYRDDRIEIYNRQGINFPIITNIGNKYAAVKKLTEHHVAPVFFIDDSPEHHLAILENLDDVNCIHFIGDKEYAKLVANVENADFISTCWHEVRHYIDRKLASF